MLRMRAKKSLRPTLTPAAAGATYVNVNNIHIKEQPMSEMVARVDDLGRPAWIALMVLGFILFWPVGLAVLGYLLWSGRMSCGRWSEHARDRWERKAARYQQRMQAWSGGGSPGPRQSYSGTGNRAFDEYRDATLQRLQEEANEFREFLGRLRTAKDKAEFDQFMSDRRRGGGEAASVNPAN